MYITNLISRFFSFLKSLFLKGLFTILPITATIFFFNFTYNLIVRWLQPLRDIEPQILQAIPGSELILCILFIMIIGAILRFFLFTPIIAYLEHLIGKIPLIRTVYSASKTVVEFFSVPGPAEEERKVVLVQYPRKDVYTIGFLLESSRHNYERAINAQRDEKIDLVKVFVPSSPAPTTGYFLIMPRAEVIETTISFEEAIKAVVSCGLITPESLNQPNEARSDSNDIS